MLKTTSLGITGMIAMTACKAAQIGPTKMTVVHPREYFSEMEKIYATAVNEWAREYNVEMEVLAVAAEAFEDFVAKMVTAVEGGNPPDLVYHTRPVPQLHSVEALEDVTDIVSEATNLYGDPPFGQRHRSFIDGKWWGIPFMVQGRGQFARRDVFEANGIDPASMETYDQRREGCLEVSRPQEEIYGWGVTVNRSGDGSGFVTGVIQNWGGQITDEDMTKLTFNSPETVSAVTWLAEIYTEEKWARMLPPGIISWTDPSNNEAYLAGNIAYTHNAASVYAKAKADGNPVFENTIVLWPAQGPLGQDLIGGGGGQHNILKGAKQIDLAKELALHMLKPEVFLPISTVSAGLFLPAYAGYYDMDQVKKEFEADPNLQTMGQTAQGSHPGLSWPAAPNPFFDALNSQAIFTDMMARIIADGLTPADAVKKAEERMAQIAKEMKVF